MDQSEKRNRYITRNILDLEGAISGLFTGIEYAPECLTARDRDMIVNLQQRLDNLRKLANKTVSNNWRKTL